VQADPDGLQQVLVNLISNAVKFTDKGGVSVSARLEGDAVRVSVDDTGAGLSEADQKRIFDRFYQAGDILRSKPSGTGLGLAITKEILSQHEASISLTSLPGRGSRFSFVLRVAP
jgi:signal transduction histidine kinase